MDSWSMKTFPKYRKAAHGRPHTYHIPGNGLVLPTEAWFWTSIPVGALVQSWCRLTPLFGPWVRTGRLERKLSPFRPIHSKAHAHTPGAFPWTKALASTDQGPDQTLFYAQKLLDSLIPNLLQEPHAAIVESCQPPLLVDPQEIDCGQYPTAFSG